MLSLRVKLPLGNLLIAPVWNRNDVKAFDAKVGYLPSNRTSLESKLMRAGLGYKELQDF